MSNRSVVSRISLCKSRRISLPPRMVPEVPYAFVVVEAPDGQQWLILCPPKKRADLLAECAEYGHTFNVLSEHRTYRPTLSKATCTKFALGEHLWLSLEVGPDKASQGYGEVWQEEAWFDLGKIMLPPLIPEPEQC